MQMQAIRAAAALFSPVLIASAQTQTRQHQGVIQGRVTDANGGPIMGTQVLVSRDDGRDAPLLVVTDGGGRFIAEELGPGLYHVLAEKD